MEPSRRRRKRNAISVLWAVGILAVILIIAFFSLANVSLLRGFIAPSYTATSASSSSSSAGIISTSSNHGSFSITYPSDYTTLESYALSLINRDRQSMNLSSVNASTVQSGQQHADSMLANSYFSHWDTQGLKPYMRYSLLNGTGFVDENIAYEETSLPAYIGTASIEEALSSLENKMVHDDYACCNNGHRDNILSPYHNRVSLGIAYDTTHVYFVEDFENYYTRLNLPAEANANQIILKGNFTASSFNPSSILIFYDSLPTSINSTTLNNEYNGAYGQGNFTGGVFPPCNGLIGCESFQQQDCSKSCITDSASTWQITNRTLDIEFSLNDFVSNYGNGVYTVYLTQGNTSPEYYTSLSVFVNQTSA